MALGRQNSSQEEPETLRQVGHLVRGGVGIYQRLERKAWIVILKRGRLGDLMHDQSALGAFSNPQMS